MRTVGEILTDWRATLAAQPERYPRIRTGTRERIPWLVRLSVLRRDDYRCKMCGWQDYSGVTLELDHCLPWSAGGSDWSDNLRVLCLPCNQGRSNRYDGAHQRRDLPTTWWCCECWAEPSPRPVWRDGTDLNLAPRVVEPSLLVFCAWCDWEAFSDLAFTDGHYARLSSVQWSPSR